MPSVCLFFLFLGDSSGTGLSAPQRAPCKWAGRGGRRIQAGWVRSVFLAAGDGCKVPRYPGIYLSCSFPPRSVCPSVRPSPPRQTGGSNWAVGVTVRTQRRHLTAGPRLPMQNRHAADAGSSLLLPGSPSTEPSSCLAAGPIPPGSSVPNVAGGLVSSHAECTEERKFSGASAPLGKREAQTLEPLGLAGCHTTLRAAMLARVCLPRAINSEQQQPAAANLTGFVESWPDKSWGGGGEGRRMGGWPAGWTLDRGLRRWCAAVLDR